MVFSCLKWLRQAGRSIIKVLELHWCGSFQTLKIPSSCGHFLNSTMAWHGRALLGEEKEAAEWEHLSFG